MTFHISKDFTFSAAHQLHGLQDGHQCGRLHGHNYVVRLTLESAWLNEHGFIVDYGDLKPFGQWIDNELDHRNLNDVFDMQTTAENMARAMAKRARDLLSLPSSVRVAVAVSETPKTWATWEE